MDQDVVVRGRAEPVQPHPPVVLLLALGHEAGRQAAYVVERLPPGSQATGENRVRSIGPSTASPVATSSTRSTDSSVPPSESW